MSLKDYLLNLRNILTTKQPVLEEKNSKVESNTTIEATKVIVMPASEAEINKILENATKEFFPKTGKWMSTCFDKPYDYSMTNLPCHLRNNRWLAKMLQKQQKLDFIDFNKILAFVHTSDIFSEERHSYEQRIVEWQIRWMISGGEHWIIDENYGGDGFLSHPLCDIGFRKGIVDTLLAMGMDKQAIEEGIEKNANLWREYFMERAFSNKFYDGCLFYEYDPIESEHKENWLKMRRYEYYCKTTCF